jgi:hypothetical protein
MLMPDDTADADAAFFYDGCRCLDTDAMMPMPMMMPTMMMMLMMRCR